MLSRISHLSEDCGGIFAMSFKSFFVLIFIFSVAPSSHGQDCFTYNGFKGANLSLNGIASITNNGLLRLTNETYQRIGRAFYPNLLRFKNSSNTSAFSFSTSIVFAIIPNLPNIGAHGIAFVISPSKDPPGALPTHYLGLFNLTTNGNSSNHIVAIELDTIRSLEFGDIDNNHVGIDINSLMSMKSAPASYFSKKNGRFNNLTLVSGAPMQLWIDYDGTRGRITVTLSPIDVPKPVQPLLSLNIDLSSILKDFMYVGFSSSTGTVKTSHYILGWSLKINGEAPMLNLASLPSLPRKKSGSKVKLMVYAIVCPIVACVLVLSIITGFFCVMRQKKFAEIVEDWEHEYCPQRFSYKDLYMATKGFTDKELLGIGGFGRVYRGILPISNNQIAVKKIFHGSRQGMREFVAEITSIGRIRHRNLVQLLGYCRREGELFLVYDFIPNGSLDKLLFNQTDVSLNWAQRFHIVKGVARGLLYLHEEWEMVVLHRDIKASNVLLDDELNGVLGDFGLARLYDHGTDPKTTHVVGTFGYIAPELARTCKATTSSDVFAFGVFLLEVACGRRPISPLGGTAEDLVLVDWVLECWKMGKILDAPDPNLRDEYVVQEMELVLKLALFCAHPSTRSRPSMSQVVQFLNQAKHLPTLSIGDFSASHSALRYDEGFDDPTRPILL